MAKLDLNDLKTLFLDEEAEKDRQRAAAERKQALDERRLALAERKQKLAEEIARQKSQKPSKHQEKCGVSLSALIVGALGVATFLGDLVLAVLVLCWFG